MKPMKIFLRYWFAITSVLSFAAGWVILAHSPKPVQSTSSSANSPANSAAPLQNSGSGIQTFGVPNGGTNSGGGFGSFLSPSNNSQGFGGFSIRTGGS